MQKYINKNLKIIQLNWDVSVLDEYKYLNLSQFIQKILHLDQQINEISIHSILSKYLTKFILFKK